MCVCVFEYVHACLPGSDVGVLSVVYHGGPMVVMNLLGQRVCVRAAAFRCGFLGGKWTFEERSVLIWEPHQLGVKRCQPLGQILSNSPLLYNRNGIDLQISSRVHSNTPLQGQVLFGILHRSQMRRIDSLWKRLWSKHRWVELICVLGKYARLLKA